MVAGMGEPWYLARSSKRGRCSIIHEMRVDPPILILTENVLTLELSLSKIQLTIKGMLYPIFLLRLFSEYQISSTNEIGIQN